MTKNNKGFGHIEALLSLVLLAAIGFSVWFALDNRDGDSAVTDSSTEQVASVDSTGENSTNSETQLSKLKSITSELTGDSTQRLNLEPSELNEQINEFGKLITKTESSNYTVDLPERYVDTSEDINPDERFLFDSAKSRIDTLAFISIKHGPATNSSTELSMVLADEEKSLRTNLAERQATDTFNVTVAEVANERIGNSVLIAQSLGEDDLARQVFTTTVLAYSENLDERLLIQITSAPEVAPDLVQGIVDIAESISF